MKTLIDYIDHTGDTGIRIKAGSLQHLFIAAAEAMFHIICPQTLSGRTLSQNIQLKADDLEQLLVNWLSELNFLFQTENFMLTDVPELSVSDSDLCLTALVNGEDLRTGKYDIHAEIKAVTYHGLYIEQKDNFWQAQIIFDI